MHNQLNRVVTEMSVWEETTMDSTFDIFKVRPGALCG